MRYLSFCSGVEAASLAWMPLGWEAVAFSEIETFPCAVLKERFPDVPNLGDCTKIHYDKNTEELYVSGADGIVSRRINAGRIDLCVGGFPCQSFSVAGKRTGLKGTSGLILEYFRLLKEIEPQWFVYENVPGMLSSEKGRDFGIILDGFRECGYHVAWRVLDAQYVRVDGYPRAVPQRRRRVFVVGYLGDWRYPAEVLFEQGCLYRDAPPRRTQGEKTPGGAGRGAQAASFRAVSIGNGQADGLGCANDGVAKTLHCMHDQQAILCYESSNSESAAPTLKAAMSGSNQVPDVLQSATVRRLLPVETERLMGFPDDHTRIPWRGKPAEKCPDSLRYKACGNSMCVNVMRWIGMRIENVERKMK